jgi:hypothetical protein
MINADYNAMRANCLLFYNSNMRYYNDNIVNKVLTKSDYYHEITTMKISTENKPDMQQTILQCTFLDDGQFDPNIVAPQAGC